MTDDVTIPLEWKNTKRAIRDLLPWDKNMRKSNGTQADELKTSYKKFKQPLPVVIGPGPKHELYDGHQRLKAWRGEWGEDLVLDCREANRTLTTQERVDLTGTLHNKAVGDWDYEVIKENFADDLNLLGMTREMVFGFEEDDKFGGDFDADENSGVRGCLIKIECDHSDKDVVISAVKKAASDIGVEISIA